MKACLRLRENTWIKVDHVMLKMWIEKYLDKSNCKHKYKYKYKYKNTFINV